MKGFDPSTSFGYQTSLDYGPVTQVLVENHIHLGADGLGFSPIRLRLAFPNAQAEGAGRAVGVPGPQSR